MEELSAVDRSQF